MPLSSLSFSIPTLCINRTTTTIICCASQSQIATVNGKIVERTEIRLGLPSKGRMAADTLDLLKLSNMEVWFQQPKDIVRKLVSGDLDLGIVGLDTVSEYGRVSVRVEECFIEIYTVNDALFYGNHV